MNQGKSLSDSSTSESEDDGDKSQPQKSYFGNLHGKGSHRYTDTFQTENFQKQATFQKQVFSSESPPTQIFNHQKRTAKQYSSTSDSEDDCVKRARFEPTIGPSAADKQNYKLSGIENEDWGFAEKEVSIKDSYKNVVSKSNEANSTSSQLVGGIGAKLLSKMGWSAGKGLGKHGQGRTEIVEASKQRGRRGLGLHLKGLEPEDVKWDENLEKESTQETILWISDCSEEPPKIDELRGWKKEGNKNIAIEDETAFCDPSVLKSVLSHKSVFDELDPEEMRKARTRANPFETIRGGIFLNRAAMKMANMDACFDFMFTKPKDHSGNSLVGPDELLYFADICAGPGGFSEYVLWRKKWESKGFGFTLRGNNDFKLDEFFSGPPETFEPHYGINGIEGDGDIYNPEYLKNFAQFVLNNTEDRGVHFVMADGGFSVESKENEQEILSKRLYLCQFLCALMIVRTGGHFTCKLFDLFTPFSVGLVYLMYRAFEKVCIFKPNTSRPANSERYIICKWRRENTEAICHYLFELNVCLEKFSLQTSDSDIVEVVPIDVLKADDDFFSYVVNSNNMIGARQIIHLDKIRAFAKNLELHEPLQSDFRKRCLAAWKIPDEARCTPKRHEPSTKFKELLQGETLSYLESQPETLTVETLGKLDSIYNYKCVVCGEITANSYRSFFLGLGRTNIYRLDFKTSKWFKLDVLLELPADTLIYAELIPELKGEGKAQRKMMCLQIIDALYLGGRDVRCLHFEERMVLACKLAKAVAKPSRLDYTPVKVKHIWQLTEVNKILNSLEMKNVKGCGGFPKLCYVAEDGLHFIPSGLLIFNTIADPWVTAYSKSKKRVYYFNRKNKESLFERQPSSSSCFMKCFSKRMYWNWEKGVQLIPEQRVEAKESALHACHLQHFVKEKLKN